MSKKQLIIDAAIELFAKKGYETTSIQEITEHCGISKGAFYLSFKSKEELFLSIIDHVITKLGSTIDHLVSGDIDDEYKMYMYFTQLFEFLSSHRDLATIFNWERPHQVEKQLFDKLVFYDKQFSYTLLKLFESLYGEAIVETKYDLVLCVKGLLKAYGEYILFEKGTVNVSVITQSFVDKINVLAKHAKKPFLTEDVFNNYGIISTYTVTLQKIEEQIKAAYERADQELEKESLLVLQQQLQSEQPSNAIIEGMLHNLRSFPGSHHISYLLRLYRRQQQNGKKHG